ncbi:MAG: hypothetical protein IIA44_04790, partial [Acidobacteria bacterium]|nr:hypothetical protein [Acidobacteriota bacterium]
YMGHPLVGDSAYGGGSAHLRGIDPHRRLSGRALIAAIGRPALHAYKLSLDHPATGERLEWSVDPPEDFMRLLELCRA